MGKILQEFTITRNILGKNTEVSASRLRDYIERVGEGMDSDTYKELSKGERNDISSFASYTGLFEQRPDGGYYPTDLNLYYKKLQDANLTNAWQWLITRSLWHFVLPNGTSSPLNGTVRELNIKFYFFKNILGLLYMLSALPGDDRFLYFHEFCILFDEDRNWSESPMTIFNKLMEVRKNGVVNRNRHFIDDLETEYHVGRDNLSTVFVKALSQTGVFIYKDNSAGTN
jgi:hypothetical protein